MDIFHRKPKTAEEQIKTLIKKRNRLYKTQPSFLDCLFSDGKLWENKTALELIYINTKIQKLQREINSNK